MRRLFAICLLSALLTSLSAQETSSSSRKLIEKSAPNYPSLARRNGLTGTVKLRVTVATDGKAKNVEVMGGNPVFVDSASDSVKKWKWSSSEHESTEVVEVKFGDGGNQGY